MEKLKIDLEFTPNPDSLKYVVNRSLISKGSLNLESKEEADKKSGLAASLFEIGGVSSVMLGGNFISINFLNQDDLQSLNIETQKRIQAYLESGKPVIEANAIQTTTSANLSEVEKKIIEVLDNEVRPAVAMDGGDIVFEKFEDGFVYLKMQGSCAGCPSSMMTLKMGVETRLKEAVPEVTEVIPV